MNSETSESLFRLYRAGRRADSKVQKAVRFAEGDEALRRKLSDQMEFDDQIVDVIHFIRPPENLRQKLREVSATPHAVRSPVWAHIFNPAVLSAILGVLLSVGFFIWQGWERMQKFPGREAVEHMLSTTQKMSGVELDPISARTGTLGDWFYMRGFEGYSVPPEIGALPAVGSRVFRLDGHPIAQLAVDRQNAILYVFRASQFGVGIEADQPWFLLEDEGWVAALSRHGDTCHLLAFRGKKEDMRAFLDGLGKK